MEIKRARFILSGLILKNMINSAKCSFSSFYIQLYWLVLSGPGQSCTVGGHQDSSLGTKTIAWCLGVLVLASHQLINCHFLHSTACNPSRACLPAPCPVHSYSPGYNNYFDCYNLQLNLYKNKYLSGSIIVSCT